MSDAQISFGVSFATLIFFAGGFYAWVRVSVAALKRDINNIGGKVRQGEIAVARRYHNTSLAIVHAAPPDKEKEICELLKEHS